MLISRVVAARTSRIEEAPTPEPHPGQVLVEIVASGVCTSDLSPWLRGPGDGGEPIELGHEISGRVVAVGSSASRWKEGEFVTGLGGPGFATHALLEEDLLLPVPAGIEPAHAIGEPIATLEEAISRTPLSPGARVAIVGLGFMGLGLLQLALARAPRTVIAVDPNPEARERALALGAAVALHPDEVAAFVDAAEGAGTADPRADVVLEATGVTPGLATASLLVRPFGTLCVVGYHHAGTAPFDMELWYKGATVVNGFCPDHPRVMRAMRDALAQVASRGFTFAPLITHRFALDGVDAAYELMAQRASGFVKAVIEP
ncbi:Threonine dehydrogenase [Leifsonia sp. 98AMF]|uniref:zinc-binding dehydrogenase n=1 Tax=unclassified Leifsonia TaxID=2663824 RepID=UPI00087D87C9|nr:MULTISPECIES: zinc-binding dehydrogenase [unclassified Leifsonia]SDH13400.1 Threonine dehydrogenase [Leifsonia sp. 197AMF]SDJ25207.1 Threonine dehydrogenase [Leifsonia sp. 466MF]SDK57560.1 Threonine dehydrogenase [Leifsonia sp. 157MF]SDN46989.1 Threonine dehydrogenase [Leifsonia sp. 509MF]SEN63833.1 Threonine dehydrogenase [Leifsonia sp. 467MF]